MVESSVQLDTIFSSLSDGTRRDILKRVSKHDLTISEIAKPYTMSFAAVAKHVGVLEKANLVRKTRNGKEQIISASPKNIRLATTYLATYERLCQERLDRLDAILRT